MELNEMNLDELLSDNSNNMTGKLFTNADVDIQISKEEPETNEETYEKNKEKAMELLKKYEESDKTISKLNEELEDYEAQLEELMKPFKEANKELFDKIDEVNKQLKQLKEIEDSIGKDILPYQRIIFSYDSDYKEISYNKVHSTYVLPTKKHQFDFKKFLEEKSDFYNSNKEIMTPYAKITDVSDYVKISVKKK